MMEVELHSLNRGVRRVVGTIRFTGIRPASSDGRMRIPMGDQMEVVQPKAEVVIHDPSAVSLGDQELATVIARELENNVIKGHAGGCEWRTV